GSWRLLQYQCQGRRKSECGDDAGPDDAETPGRPFPTEDPSRNEGGASLLPNRRPWGTEVAPSEGRKLHALGCPATAASARHPILRDYDQPWNIFDGGSGRDARRVFQDAPRGSGPSRDRQDWKHRTVRYPVQVFARGNGAGRFPGDWSNSGF